MGAIASLIPASRLFTQPFIQTQIKENIKAPRHWPLCGEFTGDRWIPRTNGQKRGKCFHLMTSSWTRGRWSDPAAFANCTHFIGMIPVSIGRVMFAIMTVYKDNVVLCNDYENHFCNICMDMSADEYHVLPSHYNDVVMGSIASLITSLAIVYSVVYSDADQRKHQSSASLAFVWEIHQGPVNFPHKWPVTRKIFHLMTSSCLTASGATLLCHQCYQVTTISSAKEYIKEILKYNDTEFTILETVLQRRNTEL